MEAPERARPCPKVLDPASNSSKHFRASSSSFVQFLEGSNSFRPYRASPETVGKGLESARN
eukprot:3367835-Alexandrium_andersonii.AAC.1